MASAVGASLVRVTGGQLGGRRLRAPRSDVRPTSDRVRESLFARLGDLSGARVLDLYAGSGALGIEAISRGAAHVTFVERSAAAIACIRGNLAALGIGDGCRVERADVESALRSLAGDSECFDLVVMDPPYASGEVAGALGALAVAGLVADSGIVVVESDRRHPVLGTAGFVTQDARRYGDTVITRLVPARGPETGGSIRP